VELDTNFYLTGAIHWHIHHPPACNILYSICHKIYPSIYLPLLLQILLYSLAAVRLIKIVFAKKRLAAGLSALILGIEPVASYFNCALLSESIYISCIYWLVAEILFTLKYNRLTYFQLLAVSSAVATAAVTRWNGIMLLLPVAILLGYHIYRNKKAVTELIIKLLYVSFLPLLLLIGVVTWQALSQNEGFWLPIGKLRWDRAGQWITSADCPDSAVATQLNWYKSNSIYRTKLNIYEFRYRFSELLHQSVADSLSRLHNPKPQYAADSILKLMAVKAEERLGISLLLNHINENMIRWYTANYLTYQHIYDSDDPIHYDFVYIRRVVETLYNTVLVNRLHPFWNNPKRLNYYVVIITVMWITGILTTVIYNTDLFTKKMILTIGGFIFLMIILPMAIYLPYKLRFFGFCFGLHICTLISNAFCRLAIKKS
jgi:hypothetical protein